MKISITYRLFFSILAATFAALLCIFLIMQWNINRGFLHYLAEMEEGRLNTLSVSLEAAYAEHGNWDFLRNDPMFWLTRLLVAWHNDRLKEFDEPVTDPSLSPPHAAEKRPRLPLIVLDADRKPLFGSPTKEMDINFKTIFNNNSIVGYVGLLPPKEFLHPKQRAFLNQQKSALIMAAFGMILIVVIFSLPLANRLTRPIRTITLATRELASGNYAIRVPATSSDELGQLAHDFNAMAATLERYEKARRQWIADISHELRTPLSVLRGEIEALLEGVRGTTPEAVQSLHSEVLRLHRLVEDLYQLAVSDLGTLAYHKGEIDLADVLMNSIDAYRADFNLKNIKLSTNIADYNKAIIFADRERLHQLFANLLDNCLKYTDSNGELIIHLTYYRDDVIVEFEDSAPEVPEQELDRLFDRFYRVEVSRCRETGGAGLGLAICKNIVEAHSGIISAHPSILGGVMIRITIPIYKGSS